MQLGLKADREGIADDGLDEFTAGNGGMPGRHAFERGILLVRGEGMDPGGEQGAALVERVFADGTPSPVVVFVGSEDELEFVGGPKEGQVFPSDTVRFTAGRAFQVDNAPDAGIDGSDVEGAAGFEEDGVAAVGERGHEGVDRGLEEGFAAGEFDEGQAVVLDAGLVPVVGGEAFDFGEDIGGRESASAAEGIGGVAVRAAQVAGGEAHEDAGEAGEGAFALQAGVDFVDKKRRDHGKRVAVPATG